MLHVELIAGKADGLKSAGAQDVRIEFPLATDSYKASALCTPCDGSIVLFERIAAQFVAMRPE